MKFLDVVKEERFLNGKRIPFKERKHEYPNVCFLYMVFNVFVLIMSFIHPVGIKGLEVVLGIGNVINLFAFFYSDKREKMLMLDYSVISWICYCWIIIKLF